MVGAMIGVTSVVPILPYVGGGGVVPLSISIAAIATVLLGPVSGLLAALVGGVIGMFVNPAAYPFGILDVFFVAVLPALFCMLATRGHQITVRISYTILMIVSGLFAELVPYYYPGEAAGFTSPPQPVYSLLVAFFWIPWILIYLSPLGTRLVSTWLSGNQSRGRFFGAVIGTLCGLMPWSLWMIAPAALVLKLSPELAVAGWVFAALSRTLLALVSAAVAAVLVGALSKSGLPIPQGALWKPKT